MRHSVTSPGGFFIGLGGIAASLFVAYAVYSFVKKPATSDELKAQQIALKLVPAADADKDIKAKIKKDTNELLAKAAAKYNEGRNPNLNDLEDLRGVVRLRAADEAATASDATLHAEAKDSTKEAKKTVLDVAMEVVAKELQQKPVKPSAIKVDIFAPAEIMMPPPLPNLGAGGVNTVTFPEIKPPAPPAPAPAPAPAPGTTPAAPHATPPAAPATPTTPPPAPTTPPQPSAATPPATVPAPASPAAPAAAEPNRPPLLNGTEPTK